MSDKQRRLFQNIANTLEMIIKESPEAHIKAELTLDFTKDEKTRFYNIAADSSKLTEREA